MIDAKELRIGNWVETYVVMLSGSYIDKNGKPQGVDELTTPTVRQKQIDVEDLRIIQSSNGLATYRGIPLTKEALEACGFRHEIHGDEDIDGGESHYILGDFWISHTGEDWFVSGLEDRVNPFKYLHQLQNLYFSLYGEELIYKTT